jgi:hypothetical protein
MGLKHVTLATLALTFAASTLGAQATDRTIRFGLLGGVSLSDITDFDLDLSEFSDGLTLKTKRRTGFQIGAFATIPMAQRFSLQPEVHYVQKGAKIDLPDFEDEGFEVSGASLALNLAYFEIPVLARFDLGQNGSTVRPFLVLGPAVSFRTACQYEAKFEGLTMKSDCKDGFFDDEEATEDPINKVDFGGIIGGGVQFGLMGFPASVQLRYGRSFTDLEKDPALGSKPKNTNFSFLIGIGF